MNKYEYDIFISHASEDKDTFVRPLAKKLELEGCSIWYDELSLQIGDSIIDSIQEGIKKSKYGLIVLSKNFITKKWTRKELNAIQSKELLFDENIILPIWHNVTSLEVFNFSPFLMDKFALDSNNCTIDQIVEKIKSRINLQVISKSQILEIIEGVINSSTLERKKIEMDMLHRFDNLFLFIEEYYKLLMDGNDDEDDFTETNRINLLQLRRRFNIPESVWLYCEKFPRTSVTCTRELLKKWINRKLTYDQCAELHVLIDENFDSDIPYILFNCPHGALKLDDSYAAVIDGLYRVGCQTTANPR